MKKSQIILIGAGVVLFLGIFFFGNTIPPKKDLPAEMPAGVASHKSLSTEAIVAQAKTTLAKEQIQHITELENSVVRGDVHKQQVSVYHQLSDFWQKNNRADLGAFYNGKAAELENSEKNLTFAATSLVSSMLLASNDPDLQNWIARSAKDFFDKVLIINPKNDSAQVGRGACYMFGNISDNPMEGILPVRAVAEKNPDNAYAQMILGLGGMKSGQYANAVKRFSKVVELQPANLEAILYLAEAYDRSGDKPNAIKWYKSAKEKIKIPDAQKELDERIKLLQQ